MNVQKVAVITVAYVLFNMFLSLYNTAIHSTPYSLGVSKIYSLGSELLTNLIVGLLAGISSGTMLIFVNGRYFKRRSFGLALTVTGIFYVVVFLCISIPIAFIMANSALGPGLSTEELILAAPNYFFQISTLVFFILWGFIILFTQFMLQVNDKFGPGVMVKFLRGQYFQPRKEERIFMFADMHSSTTIAEQLGNEQYFNLLSDMFADITAPIINTSGEIYQYVGDEIVISWPLGKGIDEAQCIHCFFQIQKRLKELAPNYKEKYGVAPELKAGLHHGEVTAGEIGVIKRDIVYSGDVLNTASRIQEQCNAYQVDFLISKPTFDLIANKNAFELIPLGNIELRGRSEKVQINTLKLM